MAISYGQFTGWVSVSYVVKSEPRCTSHKPRASYQRWLVRGDLVHGNCPHATTQSYKPYITPSYLTQVNTLSEIQLLLVMGLLGRKRTSEYIFWTFFKYSHITITAGVAAEDDQ